MNEDDLLKSITELRMWQRHWLLRQHDNSGRVLRENLELSEHLDAVLKVAETLG